MAADKDILVSFVEDLDALLKHETQGVNAHMEPGWERVNRIDSVFNTLTLEAMNSPHLLVHVVRTDLERSSSRRRDWRHTVAFLYKNTDQNDADRRKSAARTAEALLATVDPFDEQISALFPHARVIMVENLEAFIGWERNESSKDEYILATAEFLQRQELA